MKTILLVMFWGEMPRDAALALSWSGSGGVCHDAGRSINVIGRKLAGMLLDVLGALGHWLSGCAREQAPIYPLVEWQYCELTISLLQCFIRAVWHDER